MLGMSRRIGETQQALMPKSPRRSFDDGAVGLGIVAAMKTETRSEPIPIVSAARATSGFREKAWESMEVDRSESYTCVISHVGKGSVRKRVCLDGGGGGEVGNYGAGAVVFFQSPVRAVAPPPVLLAEDFLSRCCLCRKSLQGIDIFMYRGERAFCSMECRFQQMVSDEHREKCSSEVLKSYEYSISPCSAPMHFAAGVVAA